MFRTFIPRTKPFHCSKGGLNSITSHMGCVGHPFFFLFLPLCRRPSEGSLTSGRGFILGISVGEHFISSLEWRGICPRLAMARLHNFGRPSGHIGHISAQRSWSLYLRRKHVFTQQDDEFRQNMQRNLASQLSGKLGDVAHFLVLGGHA